MRSVNATDHGSVMLVLLTWNWESDTTHATDSESSGTDECGDVEGSHRGE